MDLKVLLVLGLPLIAIVYSIGLAYQLMQRPQGNAAMKKVAAAIHEGANAYLFQQYKVMSVVGLVITLFLPFLFYQQWWVVAAFILGAVLSSLAGYSGMQVAIRSNIRTAEAARSGLASALLVALSAGSVTGLLVASLALIGVGYGYWAMVEAGVSEAEVMNSLIAMGFGASLVSVFARLGGGIFTKGADIGADLVGKVEAHIPEDDPRNPAVIADNVGDNVGDCAGMAADLFETYVVTLVATMLLSLVTFDAGPEAGFPPLILYTLAIGGVGCVATVCGSFMTKFIVGRYSVMRTMTVELLIVAILAGLGFIPATSWIIGMDVIGTSTITGLNLYLCALVGLLVTVGLLFITDYYTSTQHHPVLSVASASSKGAAVNIIFGTAVGMQAVAFPTLLICASIAITYLLGGVFGIAIAVTAMLSLCGIITTMDAYGPVTDNAGGIAEMANMEDKVREVTDELDAAGNTTKAITKGYAVGSAALGALVLFSAFSQDLQHLIAKSDSYFSGVVVELGIDNPYVLIGLLFGGLLPFLFASLSLTSAGHAASAVVAEVRRQFADGLILKGKKQPDYRTAVALLTKEAIYRMMAPALLPIVAPFLLYFTLSFVSKDAALAAISSALIGVVISGFALAIYLTTSGAAWDNAKKLVESGAYGGKGTAIHDATVIGDTVGDPFKDTAGPAINPMIKVVNIVTYMLVVYLAS